LNSSFTRKRSTSVIRSYRPDRGPPRQPGYQQRSGPRRKQAQVEIVVKEYAVPAIALLAATVFLGPFIGAIIIGAVGFGVAVAAATLAFSLSWLFIPGFILLFGVPMGIFAGAASMLFLPTLLQLGLIAGAVWFGSSLARSLWSVPVEEYVDSDATIDVDAMSFESMEYELEEETRRRERELKEFDDLLKKRERFQRGR